MFRNGSVRVLVSAVLLSLISGGTVMAWEFSEHRDISVAAVSQLDSTRRSQLDTLWNWARTGHEKRLTESVILLEQPLQVEYLDWATWPAVSGDHSCSAADMLSTVLESEWVMNVARIAEQFKHRVREAKSRAQRINAMHTLDVQLLRADVLLVSRAVSNSGHFMLARPSIHTDERTYFQECIAQGVELNAYAVYTWYHQRALQKAAMLRQSGVSREERNKLALSMLADEAYGLHFLQDMFAAGHATGSWGDASVRKGTHDYYNEEGYETFTWSGKPLVLLGDAFIREQDVQVAAHVVAASLSQILDVYSGQAPLHPSRLPFGTSPDTLNTCSNEVMPVELIKDGSLEYCQTILTETPVPALSYGLGDMPRFRTEVGGFIGVSPYSVLAGWNDALESAGTSAMGAGSIGINIRAGLGLDGIMSEGDDGLAFVEIGTSYDSRSTASYRVRESGALPTERLVQVPARTAISTRIRLPFYAVPGDLLLAGLLVAPWSQETFTEFAIAASTGGLFGWQSGIATSIGRFQFMIGREVGVQFLGFVEGDEMAFSTTNDPASTVTVRLRTILIDAPIVEWRLFRSFSQDQHSSVAVQLCGTADVPVLLAHAVLPVDQVRLQPRWGLAIRALFDWRYYY